MTPPRTSGGLNRRGQSMARMVKCTKLGKQLPGLQQRPFKGPFGERVYAEISEDAWKQWLGQSTMVINENRLNPAEPAAQKMLFAACEAFLFGSQQAKPAGYTPPVPAEERNP